MGDQTVPNGESVPEPEHPASVEKEESVIPTPDEAREGEIDIDLDDPDVEKAATKIQAGFKGHRARKEVGSGDWGERKSTTKFLCTFPTETLRIINPSLS